MWKNALQKMPNNLESIFNRSLIHNPQKLKDWLREIVGVDDLNQVRNYAIRSHGVKPKFYPGERKNISLIDATCPFVKSPVICQGFIRTRLLGSGGG